MALNERRLDRLVAVAVGLAAFVVYLLTLAPDVLPGDSGEFQMAAPLLGIVHPTGYPLYLLIAKAFTYLPFGTAAYRVNLFSAVAGALAAGLLCFAVNGSLANTGVTPAVRRMLAVAAALAFAFTPTFWGQSTEAEVYALHAVFVVALLGLAATVAECPQRLPWLALLFGLSLTHHRTTILLAPALLMLVWGVQLPLRRWVGLTLIAAAPLLLYLYTPLRYAATPYMRVVLDAQHTLVSFEPTQVGLLAHFLGSGFGGALGWDALSNERLAGTPSGIASLLGGDVGWLVLLLAVWGGIAPWATERSMRLRRISLALALTLIASVVFNSAYHIGDIADYYTPVLLGVVWLAAQGTADLVQRLPRRFAATLLGGSLLLPLWLLSAGYSAQSQHAPVRGPASVLMAAAPRDAVLISNDRDEMTPILYLQHAEGMRPDLAPLFPLITPDLPDVVTLTRYALQATRPVYLVKPMPGLETVFDLRPDGRLERVTGTADTTFARPLAAAAPGANMLGWSALASTRALTVTLVWEAGAAARPDFSSYVHVLDASGNKLAQSDHRPGGDYYPPSAWPRGERIRDVHVLGVPPGTADLRLLAGAYYAAESSPALNGIGRVELGVVAAGR